MRFWDTSALVPPLPPSSADGRGTSGTGGEYSSIQSHRSLMAVSPTRWFTEET